MSHRSPEASCCTGSESVPSASRLNGSSAAPPVVCMESEGTTLSSKSPAIARFGQRRSVRPKAVSAPFAQATRAEQEEEEEEALVASSLTSRAGWTACAHEHAPPPLEADAGCCMRRRGAPRPLRRCSSGISFARAVRAKAMKKFDCSQFGPGPLYRGCLNRVQNVTLFTFTLGKHSFDAKLFLAPVADIRPMQRFDNALAPVCHGHGRLPRP